MATARARAKRSFRVTILQIFAVLILITISGSGFIFYYRATDVILDQSDKLVQEVTAKIIERTGNYLNVPAMQAKAISSFVTEPNIVDIRDKLWEYSWEQLLVLPQVQSIFVADTNGSYVQVRREPRYATRYIDRSVNPATETWLYRDLDYGVLRSRSKVPTFDPRTRPWYQNTQTDKRIYWTDVYVFTTAQTPGISSSYPVVDESGSLIAVVCVNTPLHSLSDFLAEQKISANGVVFITNEKDELLAFPDNTKTTKLDPLTGKQSLTLVSELEQQWLVDAYRGLRTAQQTPQEITRKPGMFAWLGRYWEKFQEGYFPSIQEIFHYVDRGFHVSRSGDKNYVTYVAPFPKNFPSNWQIVVALPEKDLIGPLNDMRRHALLAAFIFLLVSLAVVSFVASSITRPIIQLAEETKKIKDFELENVNYVPSRIKEVDMMSDAILSTSTGLQSFKKYVPAKLVRRLMDLGIEARPGGEEMEITALFSDVEGFTSITESTPPQELMSQLSEYFKAVSDVILDQQGTIDKYIGDAVMAFWGAPAKLEDAPYRACRAALLSQARIQELNEAWKGVGKPAFNTRIGLHTDHMIVGNLGSDDRLNYTAIGHGVNLASRLEGTNKIYGTRIIVSEHTYKQVCDRFQFRLLDAVAVKGQTQSYRIYELVGENDVPVSLAIQRLCSRYERALNLYFEGKWSDALAAFNELAVDYPADKATAVMIERCRSFVDSPAKAPDDWDGSIALNEK